MTLPWTAERVVDAGLAQQLIETQFPEFAPATLQELGVGWDNSAFLLNGVHVFRFPRRQIAVDLLIAETRVLPGLAARLPLSIPIPIFLGQPEARFPWPFAGYRRLPGRTACRLALGDAERARLAEPLARFLAELHAIPANDAMVLGAGLDRLGRMDVDRRSKQIEQRLRDIVRLGLAKDESAWNRILAEAAAIDRASKTEPLAAQGSLVHGDLYARHLRVDEAGELSGVIDWGDVHLGNPAIDLSVACGFLPPEAHAGFWAAYGPIDANCWVLARFKALLTAVMLVVYGHDVGDRDLAREGLTTLAYLERE